MAYLRDVAIGRFIEEMTIKNISVIIHYNNSDIIQYFLNNKPLLQKIIEKIEDDNLVNKSEGVLFMLELISCSKDLVKKYFNI